MRRGGVRDGGAADRQFVAAAYYTDLYLRVKKMVKIKVKNAKKKDATGTKITSIDRLEKNVTLFFEDLSS